MEDVSRSRIDPINSVWIWTWCDFSHFLRAFFFQHSCWFVREGFRWLLSMKGRWDRWALWVEVCALPLVYWCVLISNKPLLDVIFLPLFLLIPKLRKKCVFFTNCLFYPPVKFQRRAETHHKDLLCCFFSSYLYFSDELNSPLKRQSDDDKHKMDFPQPNDP